MTDPHRPPAPPPAGPPAPPPGAGPGGPGPRYGHGTGPAAAPGRAAVSPWPDRLVLAGILAAAVLITVRYQLPKGAGLYGELWFAAMVAGGLLLAWAGAKRLLGLPPVTLRRPPRDRG